MPKRATQDHEWELWKDEITLLYRKNPMEEVIKIMAAQHGFCKKYAGCIHGYDLVLTLAPTARVRGSSPKLESRKKRPQARVGLHYSSI